MRGPRRLLVATVALVGAAATLPALATTAAAMPSLTVPDDSVRIVAQFPASLAGGSFMITRDAGTKTQAATETISTGSLPLSGLVSVDVPREGLPADNGAAFIQVLAALPIPGTDTALQSVASLGLTEATLSETPILTLVPPAPTVVPAYTYEEAVALTGGGGKVGEEPPTPAEIEQMQADTAAYPVAVPEHVDPAGVLTEPGVNVVASDGSAAESTGPGATMDDLLAGPAHPSRPLQNGEDYALSTPRVRTVQYSSDQVTDGRDIPGVYTFRSWSTQGYGMWATFKMSATAETVTQNGYRAEAGAFSVNGTMSMSKEASTGSTTTDIWPKRSDCWRNESTGQFPSNVDDGPDCGNLFYGFIGAYGNDTWRWERHLASFCDGAWFCTHTVYETVRNRYYIGGTFNDDFVGMTDYGKKPASIKAGSYGNWTGILPGSQRSSDFNNSFTKTRGASVSVKASWGSAYGSATFETTTSQRNESLASMAYEFRDIRTPSETTGHMYMFWYYDMDGSRRLDHFSCEFDPGWSSSTNSCWVNGS